MTDYEFYFEYAATNHLLYNGGGGTQDKIIFEDVRQTGVAKSASWVLYALNV